MAGMIVAEGGVEGVAGGGVEGGAEGGVEGGAEGVGRGQGRSHTPSWSCCRCCRSRLCCDDDGSGRATDADADADAGPAGQSHHMRQSMQRIQCVHASKRRWQTSSQRHTDSRCTLARPYTLNCGCGTHDENVTRLRCAVAVQTVAHSNCHPDVLYNNMI